MCKTGTVPSAAFLSLGRVIVLSSVRSVAVGLGPLIKRFEHLGGYCATVQPRYYDIVGTAKKCRYRELSL